MAFLRYFAVSLVKNRMTVSRYFAVSSAKKRAAVVRISDEFMENGIVSVLEFERKLIAGMRIFLRISMFSGMAERWQTTQGKGRVYLVNLTACGAATKFVSTTAACRLCAFRSSAICADLQ